MENFNLKKVKLTKGNGLELFFTETKQVSKEVKSVLEKTIKCKDEPHPDLVSALQNFQPLVRYDEGYTQKTEINITGVTCVAGEVIIITHTKVKKSGTTSVNSGRITKESETFGRADEAFKAWEALRMEAHEYVVNDKRAQLNIFSPEAQDQKSNKKKEKAVAEAV